MRTCVKFTFANKIEAMHERSLVSVKIEPRSTSRLSSALFSLASILFKRLKFTCVNVRNQKRVSGNQPKAWLPMVALTVKMARTVYEREIGRGLATCFSHGGNPTMD